MKVCVVHHYRIEKIRFIYIPVDPSWAKQRDVEDSYFKYKISVSMLNMHMTA